MLFNKDNFLEFVKDIVVGTNKPKTTGGATPADGGFNQDAAVSVGDLAPATASTTVTTDAAGLRAIKSLHGQTTIGTFGFLVPRDYDQNTDKLIVRLVMAMSGNTDTPVVSVTSSTQSPTSASSSTYGAIAAGTVGSTSALSSTITVYEVDMSNQSLVRDEIVALKLTAGAHTTDDLFIYAIELVYASCLVAFQEAFNGAGTKVGYDALGNPLR